MIITGHWAGAQQHWRINARYLQIDPHWGNTEKSLTLDSDIIFQASIEPNQSADKLA